MATQHIPRPHLILLVSLCLLGLTRFIWTADIPFILDEPELILTALEHNEMGIVTTHGLRGSKGVDYGPFPLWFYRGALSLTHNIFQVAQFRTLFITVMSATALLWIARLCPFLYAPFGAFLFLSPYTWFYSRDLWDNTFLLPLTLLALAAYLDFLKSHRVRSWIISFSCLTFACLTHLMVLPLACALTLHLVFFRLKWFFTGGRKTIPVLGALVLLSLPYLLHLFFQSPHKEFSTGDVGHLLTPLLGPRIFSSLGLEYFLGSRWVQDLFGGRLWGPIFLGLIACSALAYLFFTIGIYSTIKSLQNSPKDSPLFHFMFLSVTSFVLVLGLSFTYRLIPFPHFHLGMSAIYFVWIWYGASQIRRHGLGKYAIGVYAGSLALGLVLFASSVHRWGGSREIHYGPTLGNLSKIVEDLETRGAKSSYRVWVKHLVDFPRSLEALERLRGLEFSDPENTRPALSLEYANPSHPNDSRIVLR